MGAWTNLADATDNSLSARKSLVCLVEARERNDVVEGGRKEMDVRSSRVDCVFSGGGSEVSRYPGSFDESPGDWHSYPLRTQEAEKAQLIEKVPRFRTGCLAFDGRDTSLLAVVLSHI
jgi:hypothetical protein